MDLAQERARLVRLLELYLRDDVDHQQLSDFAWSVIDYFSGAEPGTLPDVQEFEDEFWFAIWQVQHLADDLHARDGVTKAVLTEALAYLKHEEPLPAYSFGLRP